jgi:hypothetical protein
MRVLYQNGQVTPSPNAQYASYPSPSLPPSATLAPGDNNPFRKSMAASRVSAYSESNYGGYEDYEGDEAAYDTHAYSEHAYDAYQQHGHAQ